MSEIIPGLVHPPAHVPTRPATSVELMPEDTVIGDEIVRHRVSARVAHWWVAITFFLTLATGLPIWWPVFGWLAPLFGGLQVCRWLHPWTGLAFAVFSLWMALSWAKDMVLHGHDREWLHVWKVWEYLRFDGHVDPAVHKYNGGQKMYFWSVLAGMLGLLASGLVLWWPQLFAPWLRNAAWILHDVTFVLFLLALIAHVYLATVGEPGTFKSMFRGTVSRAWARTHHPAWYKAVMDKSGK